MTPSFRKNQSELEFQKLAIDGPDPKLNTRFTPTKELALGPALSMLTGKLPHSSRGLITISEFEGPVGVADFVGVTSFADSLTARIDAGIPPLKSLADATLLASITAGRWWSIATLADRLRQDESTLKTRTKRLEKLGYLQHSGQSIRRCSFLKPIGRLYTFEAKVDDWRRASAQAFRYSRWSDASSVVLLHAPRNIDAVKAQANSLRLGLAIGDRWIIRPNISTPHAGQRLLASELIYGSVRQFIGS